MDSLELSGSRRHPPLLSAYDRSATQHHGADHRRAPDAGRMIRVVQFADVANRYDFIDNIVQFADPTRFTIGVCVRTPDSNIAEPVYHPDTCRWVLPGLGKRAIPTTAWRLAQLLRRWRADI